MSKYIIRSVIFCLFFSIQWNVYGQSVESEKQSQNTNSPERQAFEFPEEPDFDDFEGEQETNDDETWFPRWFNASGEFSKSAYRLRSNHPLNPKQALFDFNENKQKIHLDLEVTPELSEQLTFRLREKYRFLKTDEEDGSKRYSLEAYLQWISETKSIVFNLGKVKVEWGSGYAWNPVQMLIPLHSTSEDEIFEDEGIEMIQMEFSLNTVTTNLIFAKLEDENVEKEDRFQFAAQMTFDLEPWEVSLVHHQATENALSNGFSFTGLATDALEIHGEWGKSNFRDRQTPKKLSQGTQYPTFYLPARYDYNEDEGKSFNRFLIGGQYTFLETMNIIFELYHNGHGYNDSEWKEIENGIEEAHQDNAWEKSSPPYSSDRGNPYAGFLKNTMDKVGEGQIRQNYTFLRYTTGESDNDWEWEQILLYNIDDESQMHQSALKKTCWDTLVLQLSVNHFRGNEFSEYGLNPYTEIYQIQASMNF